MEKSMREEWRPVRGFEEYAEINNLGQIHRFERVIYCGRNHKSKRIQEEQFTYGSESGDYLKASIGGITKGVHQWVYLTFVGDIPEGLQVNHIDEDKHNNRLDNLNLMTPKENTRWGTGIERNAAARRGKPNPKVADTLRGRKRPDIAAALKGRKQSPEHVARVAAALRGKKRPYVAAALSKAVQALDKNGNVVYEFPSTMEAQRQGFDAGNISKCCNGKLKKYKGLIWRFRSPQ